MPQMNQSSQTLGSQPRVGLRTALRTAPLFPMAVGMLLGITLDRFTSPPIWIAPALLVAMTLLAWIRLVRTNYGGCIALVASLAVGGVMHWSQARVIPDSSIAHYVTDSGNTSGSVRQIARVRGRVVSEARTPQPRPWPFSRWIRRGDRTNFILETDSIEVTSESTNGDQLGYRDPYDESHNRRFAAVSGRIRVTVNEAVLNLRVGERVSIFGWLYGLRPPSNPGGFDWQDRYRRQGIVAGMSCKHRENVERLDPPAPQETFGQDLIQSFRNHIRGLLLDDLVVGSDDNDGLLEAMVLGHRSRLDRELNDVFVQAGCIHFLAVSGTHMVILLSCVWGVGRMILRNQRGVAVLMMLAAVAYALVAEPRPPILRATVVALLYGASILIARPGGRLNWLSAAAVVLMLINPLMVFDVGFQLSFAAVLGLLFLAPALSQLARSCWPTTDSTKLARIPDRIDPTATVSVYGGLTKRAALWFGWGVRGLLFVSLAAWLAGLPIVAFHFHRVQPWGPINSVLVFPLVYVVMILGFAKVAVSAVLPALGPVLGLALTTMDGWLVSLVEVLASLPGSNLTVTSPPMWLIALYYGVLLTVVVLFRKPETVPDSGSHASQESRTGFARRRGWILVAALVVFASGVVAWRWPAGATHRLVVNVLSVGSGMAAVIELPDGRTILSDAGSPSSYDVGRSTVVPFLRHRGITHLDRVYISHPNLDHYSGIPSILEAIPCDQVVISNHFVEASRSRPRSAASHLLDMIEKSGTRLSVMDYSSTSWELGGVLFERLWPDPALGESLTTNDTSLVVKLTYAGKSLLLTGDIEAEPQRRLLERGDLKSDVLILPHHGGMERNSQEFFQAVSPRFAIRSSSEQMANTVNGLANAVGDIPIINTADSGAVRIVIDQNGISVHTHRN